MKKYLLFVALFFCSVNLFAQQCQYLNFSSSCSTVVYAHPPSSCPTWTTNCGWSRSHGSPEFVIDNTPYMDKCPSGDVCNNNYVHMVADASGGEGMYTPFSFIANQTVSISLSILTTSTGGGSGSLFFYAVNGLTPAALQCQDNPPVENQKQLIGQINDINNAWTTYTLPDFTPNANYSQLWVYSTLTNSGTQYNVSIRGVNSVFSICSVCNLAAPAGLSTTNNTNTLNWNNVAGASSYNVGIMLSHNGVITNTSQQVTTNSLKYCNAVAGDIVTFTVTAICGNNLTAGQSSSYTFTSTLAVPVAPTNLAFSYTANSSGYNLTWNPVVGATAYELWVADVTNNPNVTPPGTGNSPYQTTNTGVPLVNANTSQLGVTITAGHTYMATVYAQGICKSSPYASYNFTVTPPPCNLAMDPATFVASNPNGTGNYSSAVNLKWGAVPGAVQYQVSYTVFRISDGSVYGSGILTTTNTSAIGNTTYSTGLYVHMQVKAQCSNGIWGAYSPMSSNFIF